MSQEQTINYISGKSAASLTSYQNCIMYMSSTGINVATDGTYAYKPLGILDNAADVTAADKNCLIAVTGTKKVRLGGVITKGNLIQASSGGVGVILDISGSIASLWTIGDAMESGVSGDVIEVNLNIHMVDKE